MKEKKAQLSLFRPCFLIGNLVLVLQRRFTAFGSAIAGLHFQRPLLVSYLEWRLANRCSSLSQALEVRIARNVLV